MVKFVVVYEHLMLFGVFGGLTHTILQHCVYCTPMPILFPLPSLHIYSSFQNFMVEVEVYVLTCLSWLSWSNVFGQIPHGVDEKEAVRIFVQFTRLESAIKGTVTIRPPNMRKYNVTT